MRDALVFHAGTALQVGRLVTNGSHALGVDGRGAAIAEARASAYAKADCIRFAGKHMRTDITQKALVIGLFME